MASTTIITKSVILAPGESFTLPNGASVISITDVLETTCAELPEPEPIVIYKYIFALNQDDNDGHPVGGEVNIDSLIINGTSVALSFTAFDTDNTGNSTGVNQWNSEALGNNALLASYPVKFNFVAFSAGGSKNDIVTVQLEMPESYQSKVLLKIVNDKFQNGFFLDGSL